MSAGLNLSTSNGQVRALIGDLDSNDPIFEFNPNGDAIDAFLSVVRNNSVKRAAAMALRAIATSEVLTKKKFRMMEIEVDTAALARELRNMANDLDAQANLDDGLTAKQGDIVAIAAVLA